MAARIVSYEFGKIEIDGKTFTRDVIILPDGVIDGWWRKEGHSLCPEDVSEVIDKYKPEKIIIGKGANGLLKVPTATRRWIENRGIRLVDLPTAAAVDYFNDLPGSARAIAGLHLTC